MKPRVSVIFDSVGITPCLRDTLGRVVWQSSRTCPRIDHVSLHEALDIAQRQYDRWMKWPRKNNLRKMSTSAAECGKMPL
jgi:hypothetical protein